MKNNTFWRDISLVKLKSYRLRLIELGIWQVLIAVILEQNLADRTIRATHQFYIEILSNNSQVTVGCTTITRQRRTQPNPADLMSFWALVDEIMAGQ